MELKKIEVRDLPYTALLYCKPGVGKSTAIGLIAEASEGNTLIFDIDRTISRTLAKGDVVKDTSKLLLDQVDNVKAWDAWVNVFNEVTPEFLAQNNIKTVAVDNISELERCLLSDLGSRGKNKGVPAMADYQYIQFNLVNSLRKMKSWGVNIVWTAWEVVEPFTNTDGSQYSRIQPRISNKIVDNICGLCDVVGWIGVNKDGEHNILLKATQNIYAKNQIDTREFCKVNDFTKFSIKEDA